LKRHRVFVYPLQRFTAETLQRLLALHRQDLPPFIVAARWTDCVPGDRAAALRTFTELGRMPAISCFAGAQSHL